MKALLDSSVLVSAFLTRGGATGAVLKAAAAGRFELCLSQAILAEVARTLDRNGKLAVRYAFTEAEVARYLSDLTGAATVALELPPIAAVCRDPADDHVLAAALATGADCIVTGDRDLLDLGIYGGVPILPVRAFLERLDAAWQ